MLTTPKLKSYHQFTTAVEPKVSIFVNESARIKCLALLSAQVSNCNETLAGLPFIRPLTYVDGNDKP